jgi:hypothetical protein
MAEKLGTHSFQLRAKKRQEEQAACRCVYVQEKHEVLRNLGKWVPKTQLKKAPTAVRKRHGGTEIPEHLKETKKGGGKKDFNLLMNE